MTPKASLRMELWRQKRYAKKIIHADAEAQRANDLQRRIWCTREYEACQRRIAEISRQLADHT